MATPKSPTLVVLGRAWNADQSWKYESVWKVAGRVVRVRIVRNAFASQSSLVVESLDPVSAAWHPLIRRPLDGAACEPISCVAKAPDLTLFRKDEESLLSEAMSIFGAL